MGEWLQRLIWAALATAAMAAFALRTPQTPLSPPPPAGSVMAQLGAFPSITEATAAWSEIRGKAPDLFANLNPVLLKVEWDGPVYFRLRVLMTDMQTARTFCEALVIQNISCIPLKQK